MVLCFATTLVTVSTNTTRQAPELAILRALGLCRWCVVWLVVLETLVVAVSALVAGTGIGLTIAIALTMIFNMMANLPFQMVFPYEMYGVVVAMVVIASGGAAMLPGVRITSARLANSLKKL
jgi:ABC-type antimicrobial peptide transport system permease subunit